MNSKNSKTSDPHRLLHNLTDKINLNMLLHQILAYNIHGKTINLKCQLQHGMKNLTRWIIFYIRY